MLKSALEGTGGSPELRHRLLRAPMASRSADLAWVCTTPASLGLTRPGGLALDSRHPRSGNVAAASGSEPGPVCQAVFEGAGYPPPQPCARAARMASPVDNSAFRAVRLARPWVAPGSTGPLSGYPGGDQTSGSGRASTSQQTFEVALAATKSTPATARRPYWVRY